jgi:hypothetical protein
MAQTPNLNLPEPVTVEQMYLIAILDELKALHILLKPGKVSSSSGMVVLKEPVPNTEYKGRGKGKVK